MSKNSAKKTSAYVEGYGCALNISETEKLQGFLEKNCFQLVDDFKKADIVVINTCAVKLTTEQRMLSRIRKLFAEKKNNSKLVAFGCLSAARGEEIKKISKKIIVLNTHLESLCKALSLKNQSFSPKIKSINCKDNISIIPLSTGCVGNCTYCITKIARGELRSYSENEIVKAFEREVKVSGEIWLTAQDSGCYGFDRKSSLPKLLKKLLQTDGNYFIRLGMMNPNNFKKVHRQLLPLFKNKHLYKFLHLPVQSGSDKILKAMGRKYSRSDFLECVRLARGACPSITISTDIIVGFPGETQKDFEDTLSLLVKAKPDVVNISRYGKRLGTAAVKMGGQVCELEKKSRSRKISAFCKKLFLEKNKLLIGKEFEAFVSEMANNGFFTARTQNYRPVLVKGRFGEFIRVRMNRAHSNFFDGEIISI
ncbi:MAG: tRNA (N(6)-L-threonylcarbamoyladenosine(37)-C(2))-methylthiotransferase [archaeon]|jgi:MiaB-like tRNA modifying enzyme